MRASKALVSSAAAAAIFSVIGLVYAESFEPVETVGSAQPDTAVAAARPASSSVAPAEL